MAAVRQRTIIFQSAQLISFVSIERLNSTQSQKCIIETKGAQRSRIDYASSSSVVGWMRLHCPSVGALNLNCITAAPPYTHFRENLRRPHLRIAGRKLELLFASNASRTVRGGPPLPSQALVSAALSYSTVRATHSLRAERAAVRILTDGVMSPF